MRVVVCPALMLAFAAGIVRADGPAVLDARVDALLDTDVGASREAACRLATAGVPGMERLEVRLAGMKNRTAVQEESAAAALAAALVFSVKRADLAAWPTLAAIAKPYIGRGRELCLKIGTLEGKFNQAGLGAEVPERRAKEEPVEVSPMEEMARLQGLALDGLEELSRSKNAENRAWVAIQLLQMEAESEGELLRRLSSDDGQFEWFDGCCIHHQTVSDYVADHLKTKSPRGKDAPKAEGSVAMRAECVFESVFIWYGGLSPSRWDLMNGLRQTGSPPAWKATTVDGWWDTVRPAWNLWWEEFHGKPYEQATREEWDRKSLNIGK